MTWLACQIPSGTRSLPTEFTSAVRFVPGRCPDRVDSAWRSWLLHTNRPLETNTVTKSVSPNRPETEVVSVRDARALRCRPPPAPPLHRGTSLIRHRLLLGPCSSPVPRGLGWFYGGGAQSLIGEVPLHPAALLPHRPVYSCRIPFRTLSVHNRTDLW